MKGTVIRRGKKWSVVLDVGRDPETGKRRREWHSGYRTRKEAEAARAELVAGFNRGSHVAPSKVTVAEWVTEWLEGLPAEGLEPNTVASYATNVRAHVVPRLGSLQLQQLTPGRVKSFYRDLLAEGRRDGSGGLAPRTVQYVGVVLGRALEDAVHQQVIPRNPARGIRKPRPAKKAPRTWTADQLRTFLGSVRDERLYPAWLTAATTGMRRSEILGLRWDAVDLKAGRLAVVQTLVLVNHRPTVKDKPKTDSSWRSVALDPTTVGVLREWRKTQLEERLVWASAWQENGLTFTREDGSPINPERFSRWFGSRVRAADVPQISLKELRHTHASLALEAGVHPKVVQERLGHSSISVTLDTYSHAIPAMQEAAAEQVAGLVFGT